MDKLNAPYPYFGGKRSVVDDVWIRFGTPSQYIEPFCGSAAMLLGAPTPAKLEVISDWSGFIANFWRAVKYQPDKVAEWADYPISHVDLHARHIWIMAQRDKLTEGLSDADWPGDAKVAGWWLWGQCSWIAGGWCEWDGKEKVRDSIPTITANQGIQAIGKIPQITTGSGITGGG